MRCYIAGLLDGTIKRKRGAKTDKSDRKKLRDWRVGEEVRYWMKVCKRAQRRRIKTPGGPYLVAREKVSNKTGIPESTIDNIYYAQRKGRKAVS